MPDFSPSQNTVQLADADTMRAELAKIISVDTSTLVDEYAGQNLPIIVLYSAADGFCSSKALTKVKFLRFFKRSATVAVMEKMVVENQRDLMRELFIKLAKQLTQG